MAKTAGVLGSGIVAQVLAAGLIKHGFEVMVGTRDTAKLAEWAKGAGKGARLGSFAEAARHGGLVVLAVKGGAAAAALELAGAANLAGKVVIDACNPIADAPPEGGVLRFTTTLGSSLMEQLQRQVPAARFVKAFSSVGNAHMVNPDFGGTRPTMFICGEDAAAKAEVTALLDAFGWEAADMGGAVAARAIEPLCMLWCIPGFLRNEWGHAFKLLRR
ncbi:DNA-binding protein [bacterium]|nr:DNA-binding protein [bacterium]